MGIGECHPLMSQAVDVRSRDLPFGIQARRIAVTHVVNEEVDYVWSGLLFGHQSILTVQPDPTAFPSWAMRLQTVWGSDRECKQTVATVVAK